MRTALLEVGDPAPWFTAASTSRPDFRFDTVGGRYILLAFFGAATSPVGRAALEAIDEMRVRFDDVKLSVFGVSNDPADAGNGMLPQRLPGIRHFFDPDLAVARLYGVAPLELGPGVAPSIAPRWVLVDPMLRVMAIVPMDAAGAHRREIARRIATLPPVPDHAGTAIEAPVMLLPRVFEPEFCDHLVALYEANGGEESGFMREIDGRTVAVTDPSHKRRRDVTIEDEALIEETRRRIRRRVVPFIQRVHQFQVTRMERYIVACYDAADGGHFRPHRDNTTSGTAHRRFAVSVNLSDDFDGGLLSFPEFGPRTYKPPKGAVCVFSCSLMHTVSPVTRGRRYAFLPFLYDDAAAKVREANNARLGEGVAAYRPAG